LINNSKSFWCSPHSSSEEISIAKVCLKRSNQDVIESERTFRGYWHILLFSES
jgi:hypothetical protein